MPLEKGLIPWLLRRIIPPISVSIMSERSASKETLKRLQEVAATQDGYFTTKQAKAVGFAEQHHPYHVQAGNWVREHRGIYRLAYYPQADRSDLVVWYLWSRGRDEEPQGVYSHQTALSLYELSDINPAKLHMTVPRRFRRNSEIPHVLVLHHADLPDGSIDWAFGVRVTRPVDTIADLLRDGSVSRDLLAQAMRDGLKRGLIVMSQFDHPRFDDESRRGLTELAREVEER